MTATAQATSQAVAEWCRIFPRQVTENLTSSVKFMKILSVVAVSTITYLKNAFPIDNYIHEQLGGIKIMTLKEKCHNDLAQFLSTSLKQAFEAFDKKYLHQMALCFYDGESKLENLIEYHVFEYTYKGGGVSMSISSKSRQMKTAVSCTLDSLDTVRAQTAQMIRACIVMMENCPESLPDACDVSLRLYYNQDAPEGYQAPGYVPAAECDDPLTGTHGETFKMGSVATPYHQMTLRTYVKDSARASHEAIVTVAEPAQITQAAEDISCTVNSEGAESDTSGPRLRCACNNFDSGDVPAALLTCQYCKTQQHAACYGLAAAAADAARAARHCCVPCAERDPRRTPTDRMLAGVVDASSRESMAILRRALDWCSSVPSVATRDLCVFGLSRVAASKLMKLFACEGIIWQEPYSDITTQSQIVPGKLKTLMGRYFQSPALGEDIIDRLVAESLPSVASQPDPVADILSPIEKVSLQNASQLGKVIQPEVKNNVEDPIMKKYREALAVVKRMDDNMIPDPFKDIENLEKRFGKRKTARDDKSTGVKTKRTKKES